MGAKTYIWVISLINILLFYKSTIKPSAKRMGDIGLSSIIM